MSEARKWCELLGEHEWEDIQATSVKIVTPIRSNTGLKHFDRVLSRKWFGASLHKCKNCRAMGFSWEEVYHKPPVGILAKAEWAFRLCFNLYVRRWIWIDKLT